MEKPRVNVEELRRGGIVALKENKFSVWVKTTCCNLNSLQLRRLADITDKYGRGFLLFTSRQIPIIPFINLEDVPDLKRELAEVEMELDRCGSRVRNLNVCYEDKVCSQAAVNSIALGEKLERFFGSPILHKIKLGVAGCSKNCISVRTLSDIGFIGVTENGIPGYDVYAGGRLGLNAQVGLQVAAHLNEDQCVKLVQNYLNLLESQGKPGERAADVINRLGFEVFKEAVTKDLDQTETASRFNCPNKVSKSSSNKEILKIRASCGEVTSDQVRKIADIAERFGEGFIHFTVRGAPEIPGVDTEDVSQIRRELGNLGLELIENGIANLQSCFGNYCLEGLADPQTLLRKIESQLSEPGNENLKITVSASGCPNSCGIAHLSDIGFHGVVEPNIDSTICSGCGLCAAVCKRKAIQVIDKKAVINTDKCGYCGQCIAICPLDAIRKKRQGFALLLGGIDAEETCLGTKIAEFISEEEALEITDNLLKMARIYGGDVRKLITDLGIADVKAKIMPGEKASIREGKL